MKNIKEIIMLTKIQVVMGKKNVKLFPLICISPGNLPRPGILPNIFIKTPAIIKIIPKNISVLCISLPH